MHSHEVCEQLMTAARRTGNYGRLEYLATRCDMQHGRLADADTTPTEPEEARA